MIRWKEIDDALGAVVSAALGAADLPAGRIRDDVKTPLVRRSYRIDVGQTDGMGTDDYAETGCDIEIYFYPADGTRPRDELNTAADAIRAALREGVTVQGVVLIPEDDITCDADGETLARIRKKIRQLNPHAGIIETSYACVEGILDSSMHEVSTSSPLESKFVKRSAKESYTRPGQYIITTTEGLPPERVEAFVREILPGALRVKGILSDTEHGWFHVDGVNDKVETRVLEASGNESKIVIIPKAGDEIAEKLIAAWNTQCRVPFSLS